MSRTLFNARDAVIPAYLQRILLRILEEQGHDRAQLLQGLGIPPERFLDEDFRLTFAQHQQFIQNAIGLTGDAHLGWRFGQCVNITSLGMLGYAVMSAENVEEAINTLTKFFRIRAPSYDLKLEYAPADSYLVPLAVHESFDFGEIRYFMFSCIVSAFEHVFQYLTQETSMIEKVELACDEPNGWQDIRHEFRFPVSFSAPVTRLQLKAAFLKKAMPTADPDTERSAKQACEHLLASVEQQSGIVKEVNEFIIKCIGNYPSLNDTASYLCLSPRTLRRELQKSSTTFQQLLDKVRASVAKSLLLNTTKTVSEIGFELGYKDTSNFNRAFKSWTGKSPGHYRE